MLGAEFVSPSLSFSLVSVVKFFKENRHYIFRVLSIPSFLVYERSGPVEDGERVEALLS